MEQINNNMNDVDDNFSNNGQPMTKEEIMAEEQRIIEEFKYGKKGKKHKPEKNNEEPTGKKSGGKGIIFAVVFVIVAVIVGLCVYFFVIKDNDKEETTEKGQYGVYSNNEDYGIVDCIYSEGSGDLTMTAYPKGQSVFLGWAQDSVYGEIVSQDATMTVNFDGNKNVKYYALFNLTTTNYSYRNINYTLFVEARLATATGLTQQYSNATLELPKYVQATSANYMTYKIASNAFNSDKVTQIRLPSSIIEIGDEAFKNCKNVESVFIDEQNKFYDDMDGKGILDKNTNNVVFATASVSEIPDGATEIADGAYYGKDIETIIIPASVEKIGEEAFANCSNLTEVIFEGDSNLKIISNKAFANTAIKNITLPESLLEIGDEAFYGSSLNQITIPASTTKIGQKVFENNESLSRVIINSQITEISSSTFKGCNNLLSVILPDSLKVIGESTFEDCTKLESPAFPTNIEDIKTNAFKNCDAITNIDLTGISTLKSIGISAFESCDKLAAVKLPANLQTLGNACFKNNPVLDEVEFAEGIKLTSIPDQCFMGAGALKTIDLPSTLTKIGNQAFEGCDFTVLTLIGDLTSIGEKAFATNENLRLVKLTSSDCTLANSNAFENANMALVIIVPKANIDTYKSENGWSDISDKIYAIEDTVIDGNGFVFTINHSIEPQSAILLGTNSDAVLNANIPEKIVIGEVEYYVEKIKAYAFNDCAKISSVNIPARVFEIGEGAFLGCSNIQSIEVSDENKIFKDDNRNLIVYKDSGKLVLGCSMSKLTDSVKTIGKYAFANVTMTELEMPAVTNIEEDAFVGANINVIIMGSTTPPTMNNDEFADMSNLSKIYVPSDSVDAYKTHPVWSNYTDLIDDIANK